MKRDIFDSVVRSAGDLAGVYEHDGRTLYFYLYAAKEGESTGVVDAIHIASGPLPCAPSDLKLFWNESEECVGLFVGRVLWAVFDVVRNRKYGGNFAPDGEPAIPAAQRFAPRDN